jgi:hypothetical protein
MTCLSRRHASRSGKMTCPARRRASRSDKMTCPARRHASRSGETCGGKTARVQVRRDATARLVRIQVRRDYASRDRRLAPIQIPRASRLYAAGWMLGFLVYFVQFDVVVC